MSPPTAKRAWNPWALIALALSAGLCPLVTVAAIPVALLALRDIRRSGRRGRRVAIAALWVGCIVTPLTSAFAIWWNGAVRIPLIEGPVEAVRAGQRGDVEAFLAGLNGGDPASAEAFLRGVTSRWGEVVSMRLAEEAPGVDAPAGAWWVGYDVMFERGAAPARALFVLHSDSGGFVLGFTELVFDDAAGGPLRWPAAKGGR